MSINGAVALWKFSRALLHGVTTPSGDVGVGPMSKYGGSGMRGFASSPEVQCALLSQLFGEKKMLQLLPCMFNFHSRMFPSDTCMC